MLETSHGFLSGIGIRYEPSIIVDPRHQSCATKLVVGERMIPHDFLGAANAIPVNIHDMLPSDTRFKILVFVGDISVEATMDRARALAERMDAPEGFLKRFGQGVHEKVFDVLCICATENDKMDFTGKCHLANEIASFSCEFCLQTYRSSSGRTGRSECTLC